MARKISNLCQINIQNYRIGNPFVFLIEEE